MFAVISDGALRADGFLAGLAVGVDLQDSMFLAPRDPFHFHFPFQGIVERNQLVRSKHLHLAMNREAIIIKILPAIDAMHRGCFFLITPLTLHLIDILSGARE